MINRMFNIAMTAVGMLLVLLGIVYQNLHAAQVGLVFLTIPYAVAIFKRAMK
jgi:hypothetical protein